MKISTALKNGSKGMTQCTRNLAENSNTVCALGAIGIAAGFTTNEFISRSKSYSDLRKAFPALSDSVEYTYKNASTGDNLTREEDLLEAIYTLNDVAKWSFSKIYKWLKARGY